MKHTKRFVPMIAGAAVALLANGCASYKTISAVTYSSPRVYSGTRLNIHALSDNHAALMKFDVEPPKYPALDLPGSLLLDTVMLPLTSSSALYEILLE